MANYTIKTNLLKIKGAQVINLKGKTATKKCLVIPLDGSGLYTGEKGVYLNLAAIKLKEQRYEETHLIKQSVDKYLFETMSEEERKEIPILGGMREVEQEHKEIEASGTVNLAAAVDEMDDLPF